MAAFEGGCAGGRGVLLASCASALDVSLSYHLAKAAITIEVTRTATCDVRENLIVASSAKVIPTYSADPEAHHEIEMSKIDGFLSNAKLGFDFYDDGRLKSVNATSRGQSEVGYKKQTGAGQILAVSSEAVKAVRGPTTAEEATAVKAEADLIAQQQRLVRCTADPENCT